MTGYEEKWTALGLAVAGAMTGIAGIFGVRKSAPRKSGDREMEYLRAMIADHNQRLTVQETLLAATLEQIEARQKSSDRRWDKVFKKLDEVSVQIAYAKGKQDR